MRLKINQILKINRVWFFFVYIAVTRSVLSRLFLGYAFFVYIAVIRLVLSRLCPVNAFFRFAFLLFIVFVVL